MAKRLMRRARMCSIFRDESASGGAVRIFTGLNSASKVQAAGTLSTRPMQFADNFLLISAVV
jgi:hypothetical protein